MEQQLEKYSNWLQFGTGYVYRFFIRLMVRWLVNWPKDADLSSGCSVIIGMCSRLPDILPANLTCLKLAQWPELKEVIIAVDCTEDRLSQTFTRKICDEFKGLNVRFVFYSPFQYFVSELLKLPYIYSWLSWCIAIREVKTNCFYIHDYDALLLGDVLGARYRDFVKNARLMQGVQWYFTNGIIPEDRLVSTFEAFVDTQWVRNVKPIEMFNKIGIYQNRRLDFDTMLDLQIRYSNLEQRGIIEMNADELAHPTQMIHQYTVFRKHPGKPWNCAALIVIPLFYYLSGKKDAFSVACSQIENRDGWKIALLNDGCVMNFEKLKLSYLEKMFLLMIQVFVKLGIEPFQDFFRYTEVLYSLIKIPDHQKWLRKQTQDQQEWITRLLKFRK